MKIGIIYCAYGTRDLVAKSLAPWLSFRKSHFDGQSVEICAVSVRFADFEGEDDGTKELLRTYLNTGDSINHLVDGPDNIPETVARGMALNYLKSKEVDIIWQVDSDEFYTTQEIRTIVNHIISNPWIGWFRLSFKNLVFNEKTYLTEPFTPPRIHVVKFGGYNIHSFSADNDVQYTGVLGNNIIRQEHIPSMLIPKEVCWIRHESWPNNERGKKKVLYQQKRWGNACSFSWDENQGGLIFNPNQPKPQISYD